MFRQSVLLITSNYIRFKNTKVLRIFNDEYRERKLKGLVNAANEFVRIG